MNKLFTALLLIISINIAHAEEGIIKKLQAYDVEVIIFEDAHARYINNEDWSHNAIADTAIAEESVQTENLDKLSLDEINETSYKDIKPVMLKKEYKRISGSSEYNVLFYGSWRQNGLDAKKAFKINIEDLQNLHKASTKNSITGNFKLVLARFLHIYNEMEYHRVPTVDTTTETSVTDATATELPTDLAEPQNEIYTINSHRRMRSKELHYIDHPLVGILIQINPVKASAKETAEKSATL